MSGRVETRQAIMYRIAVAWEDESGGTRHQDGRVEDRSRSGDGIFVNKAIPAGTRVKVRERREERTGTVRYCRAEEIGYFIGIKYDEPTVIIPS
jgi:hypothetical protein